MLHQQLLPDVIGNTPLLYLSRDGGLSWELVGGAPTGEDLLEWISREVAVRVLERADRR